MAPLATLARLLLLRMEHLLLHAPEGRLRRRARRRDRRQPFVVIARAVQLLKIDAKINEAQGLLLAIDSEASVPDSVIRVFVNPEAAPNLAHVGVMSRYLNGKGMGFIASTAKAAGNVDVWDGNGKAVAAYKQMEATVKERCAACGATWTIVRAGTLKGGASASAACGTRPLASQPWGAHCGSRPASARSSHACVCAWPKGSICHVPRGMALSPKFFVRNWWPRVVCGGTAARSAADGGQGEWNTQVPTWSTIST